MIRFSIYFLLFYFGSIFNCESKFIAFPKEIESGNFEYIYGLEISRLPYSIGEDMFQQLPMIAIDMRYGLPYDFSLTANYRTIIITNSISLGLQWSISTGDFSAAIGNSFMYWYGVAEFGSMDVSAGAYENIPSVSVGYKFKDLYFTLKGDATIMTSIARQVSDIEVETSKFKLFGLRGSFIIEQPFYKDSNILLGFKLNYTAYHYPAWIAFTTAKHWLFIPEFQIGFKL
jgi:hypothetical protein